MHRVQNESVLWMCVERNKMSSSHNALPTPRIFLKLLSHETTFTSRMEKGIQKKLKFQLWKFVATNVCFWCLAFAKWQYFRDEWFRKEYFGFWIFYELGTVEWISTSVFSHCHYHNHKLIISYSVICVSMICASLSLTVSGRTILFTIVQVRVEGENNIDHAHLKH